MTSTTTTGLSYWPADTSFPLLTDRTVGTLLRQRSQENPDAVALTGANRHGESVEFTYAELYAEAERTARRILSLVEPGEFVAIWAPNLVEWVVVEYAAALAGTPLVALNPVLKSHELEYALKNSESSLLVYSEKSRALELGDVAREVAQKASTVRSLLSLDELAQVDVDDELSLPEVGSDDLFMLQYTSGTTGSPKGVLLRHVSVINNAKLTMEVIDAPHGVSTVNPLPMFHTAACVIGTLGPLYLGGTSHLVEQFDPDGVLDLIAETDARILYFVPTVLGALLQAAQKRGGPWPHIDTICGGASNVPRSMIEQAEEVFGASVHNLFGQTELSPVLTAIRKSDSHDDMLTTVGRPIPQVECKIVDPASRETVPVGTPGEICARGHSQFVGYRNNPVATAETIDEDGWVHTGDMGAMDDRGMITLTGRLKELIIRGGENISPAEIETVLHEHPAVLEAAAIGLPDEKWGEIVGAVLRLDGEPQESFASELRALCDEKLAKYKIPAKFFITSEMPQTPTGKVRKFQLNDLVGSDQLTEMTV